MQMGFLMSERVKRGRRSPIINVVMAKIIVIIYVKVTPNGNDFVNEPLKVHVALHFKYTATVRKRISKSTQRRPKLELIYLKLTCACKNWCKKLEHHLLSALQWCQIRQKWIILWRMCHVLPGDWFKGEVDLKKIWSGNSILTLSCLNMTSHYGSCSWNLDVVPWYVVAIIIVGLDLISWALQLAFSYSLKFTKLCVDFLTP